MAFIHVVVSEKSAEFLEVHPIGSHLNEKFNLKTMKFEISQEAQGLLRSVCQDGRQWPHKTV